MKYQERFIAYAASHGRTPEGQLEADTTNFPGGKMCGFMLWISQKKQAFRKAHPSAFIGEMIADHDAFTKFLLLAKT